MSKQMALNQLCESPPSSDGNDDITIQMDALCPMCRVGQQRDGGCTIRRVSHETSIAHVWTTITCSCMFCGNQLSNLKDYCGHVMSDPSCAQFPCPGAPECPFRGNLSSKSFAHHVENCQYAQAKLLQKWLDEENRPQFFRRVLCEMLLDWFACSR